MDSPAARRAFPVKIYTLVAATIPALISSALLGLVASNYYTSEDTRRWVIQNRATTQIVVQWLSMALSACQIYVLSSVLRFWTSTRLIAKPLKLDVVKLLDALAACRLDVDVPGAFFTILVMYLCVVQVPGALWAGALTPVSSNKTVTTTYEIPEYSESTRDSGWGYTCPPNYRCDGMTTVNSTTLGSFSYQAWKDITGLLVNSVRDASSSDNSTVPQYDKLDNTRYKYHGRSFGVGSTVGLMEDPRSAEKDLGRPLSSYTYEEVGYRNRVTCGFNQSSQMTIDVSTEDGLQTIYQVTGSLPLGEIVYSYPVWGWGNDFGLVGVQNGARFQYGLSGGYYLAFLNNTQCDVSFEPTLFSVEVDKDRRLITVVPESVSAEPMDHVAIEDSTAAIAFMGPQFIAMTVTTLYTATFADTFWRNSLNVMRRNGRNNQTDEDFTTAIAEGLEVILDNILGNTGAAQAMIRDTKVTEANVIYQAMNIGEAKYTYSAFALSFLILLLVILDAVRTGLWANLPLFNPLDLKSAILGVAASTDLLRPELDHWDGDAADRSVGAIKILSSDKEPKLLFQNKTRCPDVPTLLFQGEMRSPGQHETSNTVPLLQLQQEQLRQSMKWSPTVQETQLQARW